MEINKIEYKISYLNSLNGFSYLHYPSIPYDLAVIYDRNRVVVKPIIEVLPGNGFFNFNGKSFFLRNFAHDDGSNVPPDWALEWINDRIKKKPYKVDLRMSDMDRFMLEGTIKRRQKELNFALDDFNKNLKSEE